MLKRLFWLITLLALPALLGACQGLVVQPETAAPATVRQVPEKISGYPVIVQTIGTIKAQ